jgi:hypothetical protein
VYYATGAARRALAVVDKTDLPVYMFQRQVKKESIYYVSLFKWKKVAETYIQAMKPLLQ